MAKHSRRTNQTGRSEGDVRHVRLEYWLLDHPNFLALSANAKVVAIYMAKRFNGFNNGQIGFGCRAGSLSAVGGGQFVERGIGLSRHQVTRALVELEASGFIVCAKAATFDQKRLTREWRLTWLASGLKSERPATKEFASVQPAKKTKPRRTGATTPPLQAHQCVYDMEPISPTDLYRLTSASIALSHRPTSEPHIYYQGVGDGVVIPLRGAKTA